MKCKILKSNIFSSLLFFLILILGSIFPLSEVQAAATEIERFNFTITGEAASIEVILNHPLDPPNNQHVSVILPKQDYDGGDNVSNAEVCLAGTPGNNWAINDYIRTANTKIITANLNISAAPDGPYKIFMVLISGDNGVVQPDCDPDKITDHVEFDVPSATTPGDGQPTDTGLSRLPRVNIPPITRFDSLKGFFETLTNILVTLSGVILLFVLILGGYQYLTSAGNPEMEEKAKHTLTWAVLGIIIVAISYAVAVFIDSFFVKPPSP